MQPAIIIGIIVLCVCLISSSVGGYLVMNASPAPEPEEDTTTPPPATSSPPLPGCMSPGAENYNKDATEDDESCTYPVQGCMDSTATNYSPAATEDDGTCIYTKTFDIRSNDKCVRKGVVNGLFRGDWFPFLEDNSNPCLTFDINTNKDGNIVDTAQTIKISNNGVTENCVKFDNYYLRFAECDSPGAYTFTADSDGNVNINNTASGNLSENIHVADGWPGGRLHKGLSWSQSDDALGGKFTLAQ